jgi:tRNA A-37 threonylcarbamoyl transferase component Bud32
MTSAHSRLQTALAGRYTVEREIGQGGMATVYLATDIRHERQVAVKVLKPDLAASIGSERFLQEIRIAARLGHPHILPLHDSGEADGFLYYVMPYVAGESLRQRLEREVELPVGDALRILRDVSEALAFAHQHGVVHRDIKPENILLSGRHALVADFGVAKAVSDATGRNQLTTIGVALGTPAYMAPEQAVADPHVDHRADIYALGVVGYEMCAGAPPFAGHSPQQVLAAHMTELPAHVSTRRTVLPRTLADALMRCLEKKPADRWQSAEELLAQLESVPTSTGGMTPTDTRPMPALRTVFARRWPAVAAIVLLLLLAGAAGIWGGRAFSRESGGATVVLRDRTQLTFTGRLQTPAISPDGKQLAFATQHCSGTACTVAVDVQDVGGSTTRRVLEGAASAYFIEWSPDRRHLLVTGSIGRRWGTHLVSLLGGPVRRVGLGGALNGGGASFFAGGDSLFVLPPYSTDSVSWIRVTNLAGATSDSIRVVTGGRRIANVDAVPGTRWIVVTMLERGVVEQLAIDRQGRFGARREVTQPQIVTRMTRDALWQSIGWRAHSVITRTPFDSATGRFGARTDTVYTGRFTSFSLTADGASLAVDEGASQHSIWALETADALAGRFQESRRILHGSTPFHAKLSPDGTRILVGREVPGPSGRSELRSSLVSFEDKSEVDLSMPAGAWFPFWTDASTLAVSARHPSGATLSLMDVRTGAHRHELAIPDSNVWGYAALPGGGWIWLPLGGEELKIHSDGRTRTFRIPSAYEVVVALSASPQGVMLLGWNAGSADTMRVSELSLQDGSATVWFSAFTDGGNIQALDDGSVIFHMYETEASATILHITGPGSVRELGSIPRPITGLNVSDDLRRAMVGTRDYFGDVFLSRVVVERR